MFTYGVNCVLVTLLRTMPWALSFHERLKICRNILDEEKLSIQGAQFETFSLLQIGQTPPPRSKGVIIRVRRACVVEDGMKGLDKIGNSIKDRVVVKYINDFGEEEIGIDSGGLFKDFVTDLSSRVFNPSYGLFKLTDVNTVYPNPDAAILHGEAEVEKIFTFLGRVLGKAIFENITIQPQFAHFFLAFMHGRYNYMHLINDMSSLDKELYKNLMFLKVCLTFFYTLTLVLLFVLEVRRRHCRSLFDLYNN